MQWLRSDYTVHGAPVCVETRESRRLRVIDSLLGFYKNKTSPPGLRVTIQDGKVGRVLGLELRDFWTGILPTGERMIFRAGAGRRQAEIPGQVQAEMDLAGRSVRMVMAPQAGPDLLQSCFLPLFCEYLAEREHYIVHAASLFIRVGRQKRVLLISGASGAGKTTLALALAGMGFGLMTDDMTFYRPESLFQSAYVWGVPSRCKVSAKTMELLPWLRHMPAAHGANPGEMAVDPAQLVQAGEEAASSTVILFLNARNPDVHRIEPLGKSAALTRLVRENVRAFENHREGSAGRAFEALGDLVRSSRCFQASLCSRLDELPGLLAPLWD